MLVICNGMYRSGSTLQYNLAREAIQLCGGEALGFYTAETFEEHAEFLSKRASSEKYFILKMHDYVPLDLSDFYYDGVRILYTFRDLRAVVLSIKEKLDYSLDAAFLMVDEALMTELSLINFEYILLQQYEVFYRREVDMLQGIIDFLGIDVSSCAVTEIADKHSVESTRTAQGHVGGMRKFLHRIKLKWPFRYIFKASDQTTLLHFNHISRFAGVIDSWKVGLQASEISLIEQRYLSWLIKKGYELNGD